MPSTSESNYYQMVSSGRTGLPVVDEKGNLVWTASRYELNQNNGNSIMFVNLFRFIFMCVSEMCVCFLGRWSMIMTFWY
jgi:hypothetical protein